MSSKPRGSGYFGEWITDPFGLPAYRYTCDHEHDPKAVSPVTGLWRPPNEHLHQVGNDRIIGVASNYGHVQVRQDEGGPKFLNDQDPAKGVHAGGFGYLTDGETVLSTVYPSHGDSFERIFGVGYYQKVVAGADLVADQVIFAPFGDDPILISQVTITNNRPAPVDLRWVEYWGCEMYQFSYKAFIQGLISKKTSVPDLRRAINRNFEHRFAPIGTDGIMATKRFKGLPAGEKAQWAITAFFMETFFRKISGGKVRPTVPEASFEDLAPPPTFLVSLDAPTDGRMTDPATFFGAGSVLDPPGLHGPLGMEFGTKAGIGGMFLERRIHLEAGEARTLYFAYGYLPEGFEQDALVNKYKANLPSLLQESCDRWKAGRISLDTVEDSWIDRELLWHHYYLRGNLTYDSFFKEHILSQGHVYQYIIGFQGAARDPLQHALPFIFTDPGVVQQILRYTFKEIRANGSIPYGLTGCGMIQPSPFAPSDLELWLLWLASEYILATRDAAFLDEEVPTYPVYGRKARKARVRDLLAREFDHLVNETGTGRHGLQRLSNGDWNDGVVHGNVPPKKVGSVTKQGESVLNAAMASYVLDHYARLLTFAGDSTGADIAKAKATAQREAVRAQWAGRWFRRAWLSDELQWIGETDLWLEPQPWAIIGGAATAEQRAALVQAIDAELRQPSPIGATLINEAVEKRTEAPGMGTSAGVWPSINGTLVWALALADGAMAWDEWQKNTLAAHAEAYPDVWYGIWSGPDTYNSHFSPYAGQTIFTPKEMETGAPSAWTGNVKIAWTDFPVMNMHPHAWPLYSLAKLLGISFTEEGLELAPALPFEEFTFSSPLVGLQKTAGGYKGWYAPAVAGTWKVSITLSEDSVERSMTVMVNGTGCEFDKQGSIISFSGANATGRRLEWEINFD
jgi:hypothetical protein